MRRWMGLRAQCNSSHHSTTARFAPAAAYCSFGYTTRLRRTTAQCERSNLRHKAVVARPFVGSISSEVRKVRPRANLQSPDTLYKRRQRIWASKERRDAHGGVGTRDARKSLKWRQVSTRHWPSQLQTKATQVQSRRKEADYRPLGCADVPARRTSPTFQRIPSPSFSR
jgi:hypothetical protein